MTTRMVRWFSGLFFVFLMAAWPILSNRLGNSSIASSGDMWTKTEWEAARSFSPLPPPPRDPTNALWTDKAAAQLGHKLFFDPGLSPRGFSCASCHDPERGFTDRLPVANTIAPIHRNTMTILNSAYFRWLTWDGSRDSLWHQAVGPIESNEEMGSSRLFVIHSVMQHYGKELEKVVKLPVGWESLWRSLPASGKPGEAAFDKLSPQEKRTVNRVFTHILKIIAAYEGKIVSKASPFDRYIAGDRGALSSEAKRGFKHFLRLECNVCHSTPLFSDDEFHNIGLIPEPKRDKGRVEGLKVLQTRPFRGSGPYSDGPPVVRAEDYRAGKSMVGSFRTPSLREVELTAPYGHNGSLKTLEDVMDHYVEITKRPRDSYLGRLDASLPEIRMTAGEKRDLIAFLRSLTSGWASKWTKPPEGIPASK